MKTKLSFFLFSLSFAFNSLFAQIDSDVKNPIEEILHQEELGSSHFAKEFLSMLTTLGLMISVLLIISWIFKRFLNTKIQQMNDMSKIKIIEKRSLSPKTAVYLLEIEQKQLIVAESQNGITLLDSSSLK